MTTPLLSIHEHGQDTNLGATVLRLARLAAAAHRHEAAARVGRVSQSLSNLVPSDPVNAGSRAEVHHHHTDVRGPHTEVGR